MGRADISAEDLAALRDRIVTAETKTWLTRA